MGGCCVPGCKRRQKKREKLYMARFPAATLNPYLRSKWISNIAQHSSKADWKPSPNAVVCEVHFTDDMWEITRVDGSRKLKRHMAFPVQFLEPAPYNHSTDREVVTSHYSILDSNIKVEESFEKDDYYNPHSMFEVMSSSLSSNTCQSLTDKDKKIRELEEKLQATNKMLHNSWKRKRMWNKNYVRLTNENMKLKMLLSKMKESIKSMLNDDQIEALAKNSTKGMKWSNETIKKSLKLKLMCGSKGYDELRAQKIPLPSSRTLRRKLEDILFEEGISQGRLDLLGELTVGFSGDKQRDALVLDQMALIAHQDWNPKIEN